MPICKQAPSSANSATNAPILRSASDKGPGRCIHQPLMIFDHRDHISNRHGAIASHAGHMAVDLKDHADARFARHGDGVIGIGAKAEVALLVHGRNGGDKRVYAHMFQHGPAFPLGTPPSDQL